MFIMRRVFTFCAILPSLRADSTDSMKKSVVPLFRELVESARRLYFAWMIKNSLGKGNLRSL